MWIDTGIKCPCCGRGIEFDDGVRGALWIDDSRTANTPAFRSEQGDAPCPHVALIEATWPGGEEAFGDGEEDLHYTYRHRDYAGEFFDGFREENVRLATATPAWVAWSDSAETSPFPLLLNVLFSEDPAALGECNPNP